MIDPKFSSAGANDKSRRRPIDWLIDSLPSDSIPAYAWRGPDFRLWPILISGFYLGALAGCTSLLLNVIGSVLWPTIAQEPHHPLRLIQVYLTFPLGERALQLNAGLLLSLACVVYLLTGMVYGALFQLAMSYCIPNAKTWGRVIFCSTLALFLWLLNFYCILAWLQPLLFHGHWIVELIPIWVAVITHLVFGWTMALIYPLGQSWTQPHE